MCFFGIFVGYCTQIVVVDDYAIRQVDGDDEPLGPSLANTCRTVLCTALIAIEKVSPETHQARARARERAK